MSARVVPARRRRRFTLAGLSGLLVAVLGSVAGVLGSLGLQTAVNAALLVLITIAGVVVALVAQTLSERGALADQARQARRAMTLQPGPVRQFGLAEAGALGTSSLASDWASRAAGPADERLGQALSESGTALVLGSEGADPVAAAFAALAAWKPDAVLLVPENADALADLLDVPTRRLVTQRRGEMYVLWLDNLPRFLGGVRLRRYDRLLETGMVTVVATARADAWTGVLGLDDDAGAVARGLAARSTSVTVTSGSAAGASPAGGEATSLAPKTDPSDGQRRMWPSDEDEAEASLLSGGTLLGLTLMAVIAAFVGFQALSGNVVKDPPPPTVAESFTKIRSQQNACGGIGVSPHRPSDGMSDVVAVAHDSDICGTADRVEVYRSRLGTLETTPALSLRLKQRPARFFRCVGSVASDPCHTNWKHGVTLILGAFSTPNRRRWLPVAIYRTGTGRYSATAFRVPRLPPDSSMTLHLAPTTAHQLGTAVLHGDAASVVTALATNGSQAATLLLGRRRGLTRLMDVHAYALSLSGGAPRSVCERAGRQDGLAPVTIDVPVGTPPAVASQAIRTAWLNVVRGGRSLHCLGWPVGSRAQRG